MYRIDVCRICSKGLPNMSKFYFRRVTSWVIFCDVTGNMEMYETSFAPSPWQKQAAALTSNGAHFENLKPHQVRHDVTKRASKRTHTLLSFVWVQYYVRNSRWAKKYPFYLRNKNKKEKHSVTSKIEIFNDARLKTIEKVKKTHYTALEFRACRRQANQEQA